MDKFRLVKEKLRTIVKNLENDKLNWTDQEIVPQQLREIADKLGTWYETLYKLENHIQKYEYWVKNKEYKRIVNLETQNQSGYWVEERLKYEEQIKKLEAECNTLATKILKLGGDISDLRMDT